MFLFAVAPTPAAFKKKASDSFHGSDKVWSTMITTDTWGKKTD